MIDRQCRHSPGEDRELRRGKYSRMGDSALVGPIVALVIGVALAILFSMRAPKKPLSVALLILVVGLLDGLTLFEGRGSFTDWSIYTAELIALSWLLIYPVLLELVRKALLPENHR